MYIKYPRTFHLPWSPGKTNDDKVLTSCDCFVNQEVVLTEKRDGENTTIYQDYCHARSIDSRSHPSRDWIKKLQSRIGYMIPDGWRICGENLYARHTLGYSNLESYFEVFSIWDENNDCLSWDETIIICKELDLISVPVIWRGIWDEDFIRSICINTVIQEGYVVRIAKTFKCQDFSSSVAKYVRSGHVQADNHWMNQVIVKNKLKIDIE